MRSEIHTRWGPAYREPAPGEVVGYAPGVFDMFHIGHLNILRRARLHCDFLIAGVVSDDVAFAQKGLRPVMHELDRVEVAAGMVFVDAAVMELTTDKLKTWSDVRFDVIFKGDDWKGSPKWARLETEFDRRGVRVEYLPYTRYTSSTGLRGMVEAARLKTH